VYFCDERLLSPDEQHWDWSMRETVGAESYSSRRLSRRVREYETKWRRHRLRQSVDAGSGPGHRRP